MKPSLQACMDQTRALLGDDDVFGGEVYTNAILLPHAQQAVRELWRCLRGAQDPFTLSDNYFILPANTQVLDPAAAGLQNFPEPEAVEWSLAGTAIGINSVTRGGDATHPNVNVMTVSPHNLSTGNQCFVWGVMGFDQFNNPNGMWAITVSDAMNFTLNGCSATGTYTVGGFISGFTNTQQFLPMQATDYIWPVDGTAANSSQTQSLYAWEGGVLKFMPASQDRQLRILYRLSGVAPSLATSIVPIDDCQDYIATRAASIAAGPRGLVQLAAQLKMEALGPMGATDGSGGLLGQLLRADIRNMQRIQYRRRPFRPRMNRQDYLIY